MQPDGPTGEPPAPAIEALAPPIPRSDAPQHPDQPVSVPRRRSTRMATTPKADPGLLGAAAALAGDTRVVLAVLAGWTLASKILGGRRRRAAPASPEAAAIESDMARLRASLALLREDNDELAAQVAQLRTVLAKARRGGVPKALVEAFDEAAAVGGGTAAGLPPALPPPAVPAADGTETPPTEGAEPETPAGRGAEGSGPFAAVLEALEQLRLENTELRGAMAQLRTENAELAERMVEVAFTGAGGVEDPEEAARGGPSPLGEWRCGAGAMGEGGVTADSPPVLPTSQNRLDAHDTVCSGAQVTAGAFVDLPTGPRTPGIGSESALDLDTSNATLLKSHIGAAAYLED